MIEISEQERERVRQLEESLWQTEYRFDRAYMDATLAADFLEFGRSGRVYNRDEILNSESGAIVAKLPLSRFHVRLITEDVALVSYISEVTCGETIERANRSSVWSKQPTGWKLRFHQGTP